MEYQGRWSDAEPGMDIPKSPCRQPKRSFVGMTQAELDELVRQRLLSKTDAHYKKTFCPPSCCRPEYLTCLGCDHYYHYLGRLKIGDVQMNPVPCCACLMYRDLLRNTLTHAIHGAAYNLYYDFFCQELTLDWDYYVYKDDFTRLFKEYPLVHPS